MEKCERETIITINQGDLAEGFFYFGTSERNHFARVCRRIGGKDRLVSLREDKDRDGSIGWWECRVPAEFLSRGTFGIGRRTHKVKNSGQFASKSAVASRSGTAHVR